MGINNTQTAYAFGQLGSALLVPSNPFTAPLDKAVVAITMLEDCTFADHGGLIAEQYSSNGLEYISTEDASGVDQTAHNITHSSPATKVSGAGGKVVTASHIFPKGITIYGRWTAVDLVGGKVILYIGD